MDLEAHYQNAITKGSDISEHLSTLSRLTSECQHITEFGICTAQSTRAFLKHDITYIGYDIQIRGEAEEFLQQAKDFGRNVTWYCADTKTVTIEETDLLFIDTLHNYDQLKKELELHAEKAKKYIVFHDTTTFEFHDEQGSGPGLWTAIREFLRDNTHWEVKERYINNNGLTVLRRVT